jgi:hypothetical protein
MVAEAMNKAPKSYWIISILALVWMLFGVMAWVMDLMLDDAALAKMSEPQRHLYEIRPQWLFGVYAVAIFTGLAGAVGLLMRKGWAITAFAVSLVAIIVQFGYTFFIMNALEALGAAAAIFPLVIFAIGIFLLWFAMRARKQQHITG